MDSVTAAVVDPLQAVVSMQAMGLLQHPSFVNVSLGAASSSGLVPGGVVVVRRRRQRILLQATRGASAHLGSLHRPFQYHLNRS